MSPQNISLRTGNSLENLRLIAAMHMLTCDTFLGENTCIPQTSQLNKYNSCADSSSMVLFFGTGAASPSLARTE